MEKEINMFAMDKGGWAPWVELMDISLKIRVNPECYQGRGNPGSDVDSEIGLFF